MKSRPLIVAAAVSALGAMTLCAQTPAWTDPSPHRATFVAVSPDVRLEILDWGGNGPAMIFLAGLGNSAHEFDDFAPRFRDRYHVYAITRRGFGASSLAPTSFDAAARARDIITVADSLHLTSAVFVGHSFGGDELSNVGVNYASRVRGLIYLDAYDYGPGPRAEIAKNRPPMKAMAHMVAADSVSADAYAARLSRIMGLRIPDADIRAGLSLAPDGHLRSDSITAAMSAAEARTIASGQTSQYSRIRAPVLAIYNGPSAPDRLLANVAALDSATQADARRFVSGLNSRSAAIQARLRAEVPGATVIVIPGGNHYIFISHPDEVERAMRAFLDRVK